MKSSLVASFVSGSGTGVGSGFGAGVGLTTLELLVTEVLVREMASLPALS